MIHTSKLQAEVKKGWTSICGIWKNKTLAERCGLPAFTIIVKRNPNAWAGPDVSPLLATVESGPFSVIKPAPGGTRYEAAQNLITTAMAMHAKEGAR